MMSNLAAESPLGVSWHNSAAIPSLNPSNVLEYFMDPSNPFYERSSNNERLRMQRLSAENTRSMTGTEYMVLHVQDPILYVIRKQHRFSPEQTTPIADYYIIAGVVYQAPDLATVVNARLLSATHHISSAFEEVASYSQYHPSKGYWWRFPSSDPNAGPGGPPSKEGNNKDKGAPRGEASSVFQRQRVDVLLNGWMRSFPPKVPTQFQQAQPEQDAAATTTSASQAVKQGTESASPDLKPPLPAQVPAIGNLKNVAEIKKEPSSPAMASGEKLIKPPAEKKPRLG